MKKFELKSDFSPQGDQKKAIKKIVSNFKKEKSQTLLGVTGSGKTFTVANTIEKLQKNTLVIAHNKTLAAQLYAEFKEFFPNNRVEYFVSYYDYYQPEAYVPSSGTYIEKDASINDTIDKLRHATTESLISDEPVIVVSSVSCIYGLGDPEEYREQKVRVSIGDKIKRDDFLIQLVNIQYKRNDYDFKRGTFRVRGDIVEIFPPSEDEKVVRVEFFDEDIEEISIKDPLTGEVFSKPSKVDIYPSSHYVVGKEKLERAIKAIKTELSVRLNQLQKEKKIEEYNRLKQRTNYDLEMLEEMGFCLGIENYSRHFTGLPTGSPPPTLIDFFEKDFLLVIDESHITVPQIGAMYRGDRSRKENLVDYGFRLPSALDNRPLNFKEFKSKLDKVLYVSATPGDYEKDHSPEVVQQITRPTGLLDPVVKILPVENQVAKALELAKKEISKNNRVLITTLTKKMAEELTDFYKKQGIKVAYLHSDIKTFERVEIINNLRRGDIDILVGINLLREGLDIPEITLVLILDADKEGFLRSERSLIQTIGRAARNSEGKVYLFADKETKSIKRAMDETYRRRKIQEEYNKKNGIKPQTIKKGISEGILGVLSKEKKKIVSNPKKALKEIKKLETKMKALAKNQEFEKAAEVRDEIKDLKKGMLDFN